MAKNSAGQVKNGTATDEEIKDELQDVNPAGNGADDDDDDGEGRKVRVQRFQIVEDKWQRKIIRVGKNPGLIFAPMGDGRYNVVDELSFEVHGQVASISDGIIYALQTFGVLEASAVGEEAEVATT